MRVGTIYLQEICDAYIQNVTCPHCECTVHAKMSRSVQTGTILFIPFIRKTVLYYTNCTSCNKKYILSKHDYNEILHSVSPCDDWNRVCKFRFENEKTNSSKSIIRSPKRVPIALFLSLILGLFGMQNLYMGHKKRFLFNISLLAFSIIMFALGLAIPAEFWAFSCAAGLAINVYWGLIDFVRILSGHAKDSNGRYLLTNGQYKKRLSVHSQLHEKTYNY